VKEDLLCSEAAAGGRDEARRTSRLYRSHGTFPTAPRGPEARVREVDHPPSGRITIIRKLGYAMPRHGWPTLPRSPYLDRRRHKSGMATFRPSGFQAPGGRWMRGWDASVVCPLHSGHNRLRHFEKTVLNLRNRPDVDDEPGGSALVVILRGRVVGNRGEE